MKGSTPHPGPHAVERGRGEREEVLGKDADVEGVYSRQPLTQMRATLASTKTGDDCPADPCKTKAWRNPSDDEEGEASYSGSQQCVLARDGSPEQQRMHRLQL